MQNDTIDLSTEQGKALYNLTTNNKVHRVLYGGQAGGGKSFLISLWIITMANNYPETRYYFARRVLKDLRDSLLLTFFDVCKLMSVEYRYHDQTKITFPNGSQIYLLECENIPSDPNFDRLGSKEYTAGAIEEGIDVDRRAADILMSRTRYKHDVYDLERKQLITCNPGDSWIRTDIVEPYEKGILKEDTIFIPATLASNPNEIFAKSYKETLESMPAFERARLLHGDWHARPKTGGEFWKDFKRDNHERKLKYDPKLALHISFDENVNPYLTCIVFQIDEVLRHGEVNYEVRQLDEICLPDPRNTRKAVCMEFQKRYYNHTSGLFIYGDATSQKEDTGKEKGENFFTDVMKYLKSYVPKKRVPSANPSVVQSGNFINHIFEKQNIGNPFENIVFYVDSECHKSLADYQYVLEDSDGTIKKVMVTNPVTKVRYQKDAHISDAFRYFFVRAFQEQYNRFKRLGINPTYESHSDVHFRRG